MKTSNRYWPEYSLIAAVLLLVIPGFWNIYLGTGAQPDPYHHLHLCTNAIWLLLLLFQLNLIRSNKYHLHKTVGLSVLAFAPLLMATTALLSVHSARKGLASGKGDFLVVQNVGVTVELGLLIVLAFVVRKRRKLHGSLLVSTAILFMGIALFFTLISFVPGFVVEGPETFYRFAKAAMTGQVICLIVGLLFVIRDFRNGWPMLLAGAFFVLNELIRSLLTGRNLILPLTESVASLSQAFTFVGTFAVMLTLLAATGMLKGKVGWRTPAEPTPVADGGSRLQR
jgi:hypothetical protein